MIKRIKEGMEYFYCKRCGEEFYEYNDYCPICGKESHGPEFEVTLEDRFLNEDETICVVLGAEQSGKYVFTQLSIDSAHKFGGVNLFGSQRMMEKNPNAFYVFKTSKYPYLQKNQQINLKLENYSSFRTSNHFEIFYDKNDFSFLDIIRLKTYQYGN